MAANAKDKLILLDVKDVDQNPNRGNDKFSAIKTLRRYWNQPAAGHNFPAVDFPAKSCCPKHL
ncbi:MAG: hypothetical protein R3335_01710 [Anaerolineales bacterium]|nr:hypothetical protein [Anaerolineales bacterium]